MSNSAGIANFALILLCLAAGTLLRKFKKLPDAAPRAFNEFIIYLSLPALILVQVPALLSVTHFDSGILVPLSMAWVLFALSSLTFLLLGRKLSWSRQTIGGLILTAGLGNTAFVGFPLLESLLGPGGLRVGVLTDQLGTFPALSTVGLLAASWYAGARVSRSVMLRRVFTFPPLLALLLAVAWWATGLYGPGIAMTTLEKLASTLVPLALVSVGFQLRIDLDVLHRRKRDLFLGLGFKLLAAPLFFLALYVGIFAQRGLTVHATLLEAAMAPMITAAIVAAEFGLDPEIANLMVGVGIPLSLVTVPLWDLVLRNL